MAEGELPPRLHLSSLDPGTGKTLLIKHFIKTLLRSPCQKEVAVLVWVSRLEEVDGYWQALAAGRDEVAILTGAAEVKVNLQTWRSATILCAAQTELPTRGTKRRLPAVFRRRHGCC